MGTFRKNSMSIGAFMAGMISKGFPQPRDGQALLPPIHHKRNKMRHQRGGGVVRPTGSKLFKKCDRQGWELWREKYDERYGV